MHKGYHTANYKGGSPTPIKGGLSVQELKQMTALRMAHTHEYGSQSLPPGPPLRNDLSYASAPPAPPPRFAPPSLDMNSRLERNDRLFSDDMRVDQYSEGRHAPASNLQSNYTMPFPAPQSTVHNHAVLQGSQIAHQQRIGYQAPLHSGTPTLTKSPARRMQSPSTVPTATSPVTPTTPTTDTNGNVPRVLTVQELKELTRRRLAREAVLDGRPLGGGSSVHSREGSVCSADELSQIAEGEMFFREEKSSLSGGSGGTDREVDAFSDLMASSMCLKADGPSPRMSPLPQQFAIYPPLRSVESSPPPSSMSAGPGPGPVHASRFPPEPLGSHAGIGIHPGLHENYGSFRPFTRDRERDLDTATQNNAVLRKLALNNANRELGIPEDYYGGSRMQSQLPTQSPPPSPRSLRNRPKLTMSYPDPLTRQRSTSSDYSSSIPFETAESVLLTPTPCSPSTARHMPRFPTGDRVPVRRESLDVFELGPGALEQPMGLVHGLGSLSSHTQAAEEGWGAGRRHSAPHVGAHGHESSGSGGGLGGGRSLGVNGLSSSVVGKAHSATACPGYSRQTMPQQGACDDDSELMALDRMNDPTADVSGLEPAMPMKTKSFSPIFLFDTSGPFSYTSESSAPIPDNSKDGRAAFEDDLAPLLASALRESDEDAAAASASTSRLSTYQQRGATRSRLFP